MSAVAPIRAGAARLGAPAKATERRPQLQVVAPVAGVRGRVAFVVLVGTILAGGLVALLMLHTLAAQDAFTVHKLQRHAEALTEAEQQLAVADEQAQSPTALAARARALGLVPTDSLRFIRRHDGTVIAVGTAAKPMPVAKPVAVGPKATPAATPSASASAATKSPKSSKAKQQVKTKSTPSVHHSAGGHG